VAFDSADTRLKNNEYESRFAELLSAIEMEQPCLVSAFSFIIIYNHIFYHFLN
jgi:hypothetical protein